MKKTICLLALFLIVACKKETKEITLKKQTPTELGREIFEDKAGCATCHLPNQKVVGPSIHEIATIYKDKNASIATFLKGHSDPIVDPSQFDVMKANFAITEIMSDEELQAIEVYMHSFLK